MAGQRLRAAVASGVTFAMLVAPAIAASETVKKPATAETLPIPDPYGLNLLIRTTLIALNQANRTGNYSVLRDLAGPQFQRIQTDASLAEIFAALRKRALDLSPIFFFDPKLVRQPAIEPSGLLRLSGFIPTRPQQVNFDLMFEPVGREWRLFGVSVGTSKPTDTVAAMSAPAAAGPNGQPAAKAAQSAKPTAGSARKPSPGSDGWATSATRSKPE